MSCTVFYQELQTHVNELVTKQLALMRGYCQAVHCMSTSNRFSKSFQCSSFVENIRMSSIIIFYISPNWAVFPISYEQIVAIRLDYRTFPFPFANIHMSVNHNTVLTCSIFGIPQPEVKCDMHLSDQERS